MRARLRALGQTTAGSFFLRLYHRYNEARLPFLAAALAYYAAFSLGPLLLLLAGWLRIFLRNRPDLAEQYREALITLVAEVLPLQANSAELVTQSFEVILASLGEGALLRSFISLLVLLWASSNFFTSLQLALEIIFDVPQSRGYIRKRLVALFLVFSVTLVIATEIVGSLMASSLSEIGLLIRSRLETLNITLPSLQLFRLGGLWTELLRLAVATFVFTLSFRYLPRQSSSWTGALLGALFSVGSILMMRIILVASLDLERFNLIYGVITGLIILLFWLYVALLLFLVGAVLVAEISASRAIDEKSLREVF